MLAAAWDHRKSTDIDLWIAPDRASELTALAPDAATWSALFQPPGHQVSVERATREHTAITLDLDGVPVSLFTSHHANRPCRNRQIMHGTVFAAATTEEILRGKLLGRWSDQAADEIPNRDLYDIVVARTVEPWALRRTFISMSDSARAQAANRLRSLPDDWHRHDPKPIIDPKFDIDLQDLGRRLADPLESGDWHAIPLTRRRDAPEVPKPSRGLDR